MTNFILTCCPGELAEHEGRSRSIARWITWFILSGSPKNTESHTQGGGLGGVHVYVNLLAWRDHYQRLYDRELRKTWRAEIEAAIDRVKSEANARPVLSLEKMVVRYPENTVAPFSQSQPLAPQVWGHKGPSFSSWRQRRW